MKVTLVTSTKNLQRYRDTGEPIECAGKFAGRSRDFVHEIQVDIEEIVFTEGLAVGHVLVQKECILGA